VRATRPSASSAGAGGAAGRRRDRAPGSHRRQGVALDLVLTGRAVGGDEALRIGLANRVVEPGGALAAAVALAEELAALPQVCMRSDRMSLLEGLDVGFAEAMANETRRGLAVITSGETAAGVMAYRNRRR
jgi:enoyl-CoA hydratase